MKRSIKNIIADFAKIQNELCKIIIMKYDLENDSSVIFSVPRSGNLELNGENWKFKRHGLGVKFIGERKKEVIDAHRNFVSYPAGFDAWRILQFIETMKDKDFNIVEDASVLESEEKVDELLSSLAAKKLIVPIEEVVGLYIEVSM